MGALEELVAKAGGCAVIDGGFATELEALGADINDLLWSAACLITRPHLIKEVNIIALGQRPAARHADAGMHVHSTSITRGQSCASCLLLVHCRLAMQCNPQRMPSDYCVAVRREKANDIFLGGGSW
jgi:hypothetical protein